MSETDFAETRLSQAIHEAGHAVARWALKADLKYVEISPDGGAGCCYGDRFQPCLPRPGECSTSERRRLCADIVIVMAGLIAQERHERHPLGNWCDWMKRAKYLAHPDIFAGDPNESDWGQVKCRIPSLGQRWRGHLDRAFDQADRIVREHQRHIETLAKALTERGRIEGDEAFAMFRCGRSGKPLIPSGAPLPR